MLNGQNTGEVIPFEKGVHQFKTVSSEQGYILFKFVGNENILQRFSFFRNFHVRITVAPFKFIVKINEHSIDIG